MLRKQGPVELLLRSQNKGFVDFIALCVYQDVDSAAGGPAHSSRNKAVRKTCFQQNYKCDDTCEANVPPMPFSIRRRFQIAIISGRKSKNFLTAHTLDMLLNRHASSMRDQALQPCGSGEDTLLGLASLSAFAAKRITILTKPSSHCILQPYTVMQRRIKTVSNPASQ